MQYHSPCCVLIAGTGSASKVFVKDQSKLLAAFGHALNECGAAYTCVRSFVNKVIDEFDWGNYEHKPEWKMFCEKMSINEDYRHSDLLDLFYGNFKQKIASFAQTMADNMESHKIFKETILAEF